MTAVIPAHPPWSSQGRVTVLGSGSALPGEAIDTDTLIAMLEARFGLTRGRAARAAGRRLGIHRRHICRAFDAATEEPRPGLSNPELCAQALRAALVQRILASDEPREDAADAKKDDWPREDIFCEHGDHLGHNH